MVAKINGFTVNYYGRDRRCLWSAVQLLKTALDLELYCSLAQALMFSSMNYRIWSHFSLYLFGSSAHLFLFCRNKCSLYCIIMYFYKHTLHLYRPRWLYIICSHGANFLWTLLTICFVIKALEKGIFLMKGLTTQASASLEKGYNFKSIF